MSLKSTYHLEAFIAIIVVALLFYLAIRIGVLAIIFFALGYFYAKMYTKVKSYFKRKLNKFKENI